MTSWACEAGTGIVRLLSKASNTGFSRHLKAGCHLLVCITSLPIDKVTHS